jgi:hypothetical protein
MKIKRVGVDLAKNVFQIHGVDSKRSPYTDIRREGEGGSRQPGADQKGACVHA